MERMECSRGRYPGLPRIGSHLHAAAANELSQVPICPSRTRGPAVSCTPHNHRCLLCNKLLEKVARRRKAYDDGYAFFWLSVSSQRPHVASRRTVVPRSGGRAGGAQHMAKERGSEDSRNSH